MANNVDININAQELVNTISQAVQEIGGKVASSTLELLEKSSPMIAKTLEEGVKSDYIYYQTHFMVNIMWAVGLFLFLIFLISLSFYCINKERHRQLNSDSEGICLGVYIASTVLGIFSFFGLMGCSVEAVNVYISAKQIEAAPTYYAAKKAIELISAAKESL